MAYRRGPGGGVIPTSHNPAYGVGMKEASGTSNSPSSGDLHTELGAGRLGGCEALASDPRPVPSGGEAEICNGQRSGRSV